MAQQILQFEDGSPVTSILPKGMMEKRANKSFMKMPWYTLAWKMWVANLQVLSMPCVRPDDDTVFSKHIHSGLVSRKNTRQHRPPVVDFCSSLYLGSHINTSISPAEVSYTKSRLCHIPYATSGFCQSYKKCC